MARHRGEASGAPGTTAVSRRAALQIMSAGAGAALATAYGQAPISVAAQGDPGENEAAPYVLTQRFQVTSLAAVDQLTSIVASDLLPQLAVMPDFQDTLIYDTETGELAIMSIFASKQGAADSYVFASQWKAKDASGQFLNYQAQVNLGRRLRYFKTTTLLSTSSPTPTPTEEPENDDDHPWDPQDLACEDCLVEWPTDRDFIGRAVVEEIVDAEAALPD